MDDFVPPDTPEPDSLATSRRDADEWVESILARCIEALEQEGSAAVEAVLREHPEEAPLMRQRLGILRELDLIGVENGASSPLPAERIGEFRLIRPIGRGGMGEVYLAEQTSLERPVALKLIRRGLDASGSAIDRFRREAQAIARLRHPNIVDIHAFGEEDGLLYIAMEFVDGPGLDAVFRELSNGTSNVEIVDLVRWGGDIARALGAAHSAGLVHRDVKPSNVLITPQGRAVLLDFGLARDLEQASLSMTGAFLGSAHYAAPEQVASQRFEIGAATDVYGLGVTLYEGVTGAVPFSGDTPEQIFHQILVADPTPPRRHAAHVSRDLETVLLKAMEKSPRDRYASAEAFADDLDAVIALRPIRARRRSPLQQALRWARRNRAMAAVLLLAALVLVGALLAQEHRARHLRGVRAGEAIERARWRLTEYRREQAELSPSLDRLRDLETELERRHLSREEGAERARLEQSVERLERRREEAFDEVLRLLDRAAQLAPQVAGGRQIRADLYVEKWRLARAAGDEGRAEHYRALAFELDGTERLRSVLSPTARLSVETEPPDADVHLFRFVEQSDLFPGGERRFVPVPFGVEGSSAVRPGTWSLRITQDVGELRQEDVVVELAGQPIEGTVLVSQGQGRVRRLDRLVSIDGVAVRDPFEARNFGRIFKAVGDAAGGTRTFLFERGGEGGEPMVLEASDLETLGIQIARPVEIARQGGVAAVVYQDGELRHLELPPGLELRTTAAPLLLSAGSRIGTSPVQDLEVEVGHYLVVAHLPGHEPRRAPLAIEASDQGADAELVRLRDFDPIGTRPHGFVRLYDQGPGRTESGEPVWMMDREVTCAEYLEFVNDPRTLAEIEASNEPIRYPRTAQIPAGYWNRLPDGRFALSERWTADMPVIGVSWLDAKAYAAWKTARSRRAGLGFRFDLPYLDHHTESQEWATMGGGRFVYGNRFRPTWIKSCFARAFPCVESVLSYPIDEAAIGVFDLSGSAAEWYEGWFWEEAGERMLLGRGWAFANVLDFSWVPVFGRREDFTDDTFGFRLVAYRDRAAGDPSERPEAPSAAR